MNARGWRQSEPGTVGALETPRLLGVALNAGGLTTADISRTTGGPENMIIDLFSESTDQRPSVHL